MRVMFFVALAFASMSCAAEQAANLAETRQVSSGSTSAPTSEKVIEDEESVSPPTSVAGAFLMSCQQDPVVSVYMVSCFFHNENGEKHNVSRDELSAVRFSTEGGGEEVLMAPSDVYWHKPEEKMHFSFVSDLKAGKVENVIVEANGREETQTQAKVEDVLKPDSEQVEKPVSQGDVPELPRTGVGSQMGQGTAQIVFRESFDVDVPPNQHGFVYVKDYSIWTFNWVNQDCNKEPVLEVRGPWENHNNRYAELYPDCIDWNSGPKAKNRSYWTNASIKISRTIDEVSPGSTYKISFRYRKGNPYSGIRFSINGNVLHEKKASEIACGVLGKKEWNDDWCEIKIEHVARGNTLKIEFADLTEKVFWQRGMLLDDILVEKLP